MKNEERLKFIFDELYNKLILNDFVIDKSGVKCVELIACKIELDPSQKLLNFNVKSTNEAYCMKELRWYMSQDLNIKNYVDDVKIWSQVADADGYVNSNYGYLVFSAENYDQFDNCVDELRHNKNSRRAIMIYNRPSMHVDYNKNGKNDFICCLANQFLIRNNELMSIVEFRSNDIIYGFFNDFYWKCTVYDMVYKELIETYPDLKIGKIIWVSNSMHCYEKHFDLLKKIYYYINNK